MSGGAWAGVELCSSCGGGVPQSVCLAFLSLFHGPLNMPGGVCASGFYVRRPRALVLLWRREKKLKYNRQVCGVSYHYITGGGMDGTYMCYVRCFH
jgi:hypothetical protein